MERNILFVSANLQGTDSGGKRTNYCSTSVKKEMGFNLAARLELKTLIPLFAFSSSNSVRGLNFSNEDNYIIISDTFLKPFKHVAIVHKLFLLMFVFFWNLTLLLTLNNSKETLSFSSAVIFYAKHNFLSHYCCLYCVSNARLVALSWFQHAQPHRSQEVAFGNTR